MTRPRRVAVGAALTVLLTSVIVVLARALGFVADTVVVAALVALAGLVLTLGVVADHGRSGPWTDDAHAAASGDRNLDPRMRTLSWACLRPDEATWRYTTGPLLRDVLGHALRTRHGIDLAREPARAKAVLPPELHPLVDDPDVPPVDTAHLAVLVDRIETL